MYTNVQRNLPEVYKCGVGGGGGGSSDSPKGSVMSPPCLAEVGRGGGG
jgi:hypothetical protein